MQLTAYLFNPVIPARFNKPNTLRNTLQWNAPVRVYRGLDNYFDIELKDFDMQPVAVRSFVFKFKVKDSSNIVVLAKQLTFAANSNNRLALNILKEDTLYLKPGLFTWGLSMINENGREVPILNGDAIGTFNLQDWVGYEGSGYCGSYNHQNIGLGPCINCNDQMRDSWRPGCMPSYCGSSGYVGSYTGYIGSFNWQPYISIEPYWNPAWGPQPYWNPQLPAGTYWSPGFCGSGYCSPQWQPIWGPYPPTPNSVIYDQAGNPIGYSGSYPSQDVGYSGW